MSYSQSFFSYFIFQEAFFCTTLHFLSSALWNVLFPKFSFSYFYLPRSFFSTKRCISGVLHSGMSYSQSFFSAFSFQEAFFRKTLHFRSSALLNILFPKFLFFDF